MKFYKKKIGLRLLTKPVKIDPKDILRFFPNAEVTERTIKVPLSFSDSAFMHSPIMSDAMLLFAKQSADEEGYSIFASILTLKELGKHLDHITEDAPLFPQYEIFLKDIIEQLERDVEIDSSVKKLYLQYIEELNNPENELKPYRESMMEFNGFLANENAKKVKLAPEHTYRIESYAGFDDVYVGTSGLGTCLFIAAYNEQNRLIAVAHLDEKTIDNYKISLDHLFNILKSNAKTKVFLLGGVDSNFFNQTLDFRCSKTLILSLVKYLKQRTDVEITGTFIFPNEDNVDSFVVKANRLNGIQFLRVDGSGRSMLDKLSLALVGNNVIGSPLDYRELVLVNNAAGKNEIIQSSLFEEQKLSESADENNNLLSHKKINPEQ